jgi:hypothetical protein
MNGELKSTIENTLSKPNVEAAGLANYSEVKRLLTAYQGGKSYLYNRIWALYILHRWKESENKRKQA